MEDWDLRIAEETRCIISNPDASDAYLRRGIALCCKGGEKSDYEKAIEDLTLAEVIYNDPNNEPSKKMDYNKTIYYRALAYYMKGEYTQAEEVLKKITGTAKPYITCKNVLFGNINYALKKYKEAVEYYEKVLEEYSAKQTKFTPPPDFLQNYKKAKDCLKDGD
jgi:tetratricopeptide (TPR) repeat protein